MPSLITIAPQILAHPWYRKWECGELPAESLKAYAREYYWQVARFPRYLSRLHSQLERVEHRQVVLDNLVDEENREAPHPELWLDFAESLGLERAEVARGTPGTAVTALTAEFDALIAGGPETALGTIIAYESQVPEVARFKAAALKAHYLDGARGERGTRFFEVHQEADVWHTQGIEAVISSVPADRMHLVQQGADRACAALWKFLDAMPA